MNREVYFCSLDKGATFLYKEWLFTKLDENTAIADEYAASDFITPETIVQEFP